MNERQLNFLHMIIIGCLTIAGTLCYVSDHYLLAGIYLFNSLVWVYINKQDVNKLNK